jgi:hypothetical protein
MTQNSTHSGTATDVDVQIMETHGGVKVYVHLFLASQGHPVCFISVKLNIVDADGGILSRLTNLLTGEKKCYS